ncbi:MAG: toxin-antitoxin system HicB family antitoxin [Acidobacteriota bacterium]
MKTMSLRLPDSLHRQLKKLAERDGVSMNQMVTVAVAEKASALMTVDYLRERATRGSRGRFEDAMASVPDVPADPEDRL